MVGPPSCIHMQDGVFIKEEVAVDKGGRIETERLDIYDSIVGMYFKHADFLL